MAEMRDEFLGEEDLALRQLTFEELVAYWNQWLLQAQATNDLDRLSYSHGVFRDEPDTIPREERCSEAAPEPSTNAIPTSRRIGKPRRGSAKDARRHARRRPAR